ncbi:MAG TPA: T9SS type A sorting domain-containing protein [Ignavibacteria bacterium]|nr:T9SS type A sorting domain-containing protein [Ignavibacteria bacterium]HMQ98965.1 T9SS type A sorting domain-containing protein [Ignavibacteria bacterium]
MRTIILYLIIIFTLCIYNNHSNSQDDVEFYITEDAMNTSIQALIDTKALNRHVGNWSSVVDIHSTVYSATLDFRNIPLDNTWIHVNMNVRANINIWAFNFDVNFDIEGDIEGGVFLVSWGNGYNVGFRASDMKNFTVTSWLPIDTWIEDAINGYAAQLPTINYIGSASIIPGVASQYFTPDSPFLKVTDNEAIVTLNVNEGYLAYDNVNYTKNHHYRYLEGGMDYVIQPGGDITFTHGSNGVNLTDGFTVQEGGIFSTVFDPNLDSEGDSPIYTAMNNSGKNLYVLDTAKPENIGKPKNIPLKYELHQNYPNPFNPSTTIKYDLKNDGKVSLVIYDIIGREVIKLVDWNEEAGYKSVTWDGRNKMGNQISSGVYFYTLRTGDFVKTVKMVFVK